MLGRDEPIVMVAMHRITPHPANPRQGDVDSIAESIDANGFYGACIVQRSSGYILAGSHRYRAARAEGASEVPVVYVDVDDEQAMRILLADNRASDVAGFDKAVLLGLLEGVETEAGGLRGTGYAAEDVAAIAGSLESPEPMVGAADDGDPTTVRVQIGPYRFVVSRELFMEWHDEVRQQVGLEPDAVRREILNRLGVA